MATNSLEKELIRVLVEITDTEKIVLTFVKTTLSELAALINGKVSKPGEFSLHVFDKSFNCYVKLENIDSVENLGRLKIIYKSSSSIPKDDSIFLEKSFSTPSTCSTESFCSLIHGQEESSYNEERKPYVKSGEDDTRVSLENVSSNIKCDNIAHTWHINYKLPKFPAALDALLCNDCQLNSSHKDEIISLIYYDICGVSNFYPKCAQYDKVISVLLKKYPKLAESSPMDVSLKIWKQKLQHKFKNMRPLDGLQNVYVLSRKSKREADETQGNSSKVSKLKASAWGVSNYLPNYEPGENQNTMEEYRKLLLVTKKERYPDHKKVKFYMDKTFPERRKLIVTRQETIEDVLTQYPWLESKIEFMEEFKRILDKKNNITDLIQNGLLQDYEGLQFLFRKKKLSLDMTTIKNQMSTVRDPADLNSSKAALAFHFLMATLRENIDSIKGISNENKPPVYIREEVEDERIIYTLICDGCVIESCEELIEVLSMYVASFYIFNLAYELKSVKTVNFILKRYIGVSDSKEVKGIVLTLYNKLNEYKCYKKK